MEILIPAGLVVVALLALLGLALGLYLYKNRNLPWDLLDTVPGLSEEDKQKAKVSFNNAKQRNKGVLLYDLSAPLVMLFVLPFVSSSAQHLPKLFRKYDNEVSINGDGWGVLRDGKWVTLAGDGLPGEVPVPYYSPEYKGDAYYDKGHKPNSFWARYIWLGLRNRASKASEDTGITLTASDREDSRTWGDLATSKKHEGTMLWKAGEHYQIMSTKKIGKFCRRTNFGFKLNNSLTFNREKAMVVCITASLPLWKGK